MVGLTDSYGKKIMADPHHSATLDFSDATIFPEVPFFASGALNKGSNFSLMES